MGSFQCFGASMVFCWLNSDSTQAIAVARRAKVKKGIAQAVRARLTVVAYIKNGRAVAGAAI
jgi:hypothetical protein